MSAVLVAGFGVTGRAVARAALAAGDRVVVVDDRGGPDAAVAAADLGVELVVGADRGRLDGLVAGADLLVVSPGIPVGHPVLAAAAEHGVAVRSEIELAAGVLARRGAAGPDLVAITGTNGKTTVTTLVRDALEASGRPAVAAGNIGPPLIDAVAAAPAGSVVVAEVSSFQLQFTDTFRPAVGAWLNLAADHLDWHPTHDHYRDAKARIWANQTVGDTAVANADDPVVRRAAAARPPGSQLVTFSTAGPGDWCELDGVLRGPGGVRLLGVDELPRRLPHDRANALAAAAVAAAAGATLDGIGTALRRAEVLPHRIARVASSAGVTWYDDSKATTPASVLAAVAGFPSVVLIAGGRNKGLDLGVLAAAVPPVRAVVAIGEAAPEVAAAFAGLVPVTAVASMGAAVAAAAAVAASGDAVILSPGCASFDWYRGYAERGDDFAALVTRLLDAHRPATPSPGGSSPEKERPRC